MELRDVIKNRRSVRSFQDKEVTDEQVNDILDMANLSPSAGNLQARRIIVVRDREMRKRFSEASLRQEPIVQAPVSLVICAVPEESAQKYEERGRDLYSVQDATIFAAYVQLAAVELGLSTVWIGAFDENMVSDISGLEKNTRPVAIIPVGYADEKPGEKDRKSLDEIIIKSK